MVWLAVHFPDPSLLQALPLFLDRLANPITAIILSATAVLFFGEIIPQSVCTRCVKPRVRCYGQCWPVFKQGTGKGRQIKAEDSGLAEGANSVWECCGRAEVGSLSLSHTHTYTQTHVAEDA